MFFWPNKPPPSASVYVRTVETTHDTGFSVRVSEADSVSALKRRIQSQMSDRLQRLFVGKIQRRCIELQDDDNQLLRNCVPELEHEWTTFFALAPEEKLLYVKTLSGDVGCYIGNNLDSIGEVKAWVAGQLDLPVDEQRLFGLWDNNNEKVAPLSDNVFLQHVASETTLHLVQARRSHVPRISFAPRPLEWTTTNVAADAANDFPEIDDWVILEVAVNAKDTAD